MRHCEQGRLAQRGIAGDLSGRPKNLWGVFSKMRAKGYGLDQVYDVRALRVVVPSKSDCYEVLREVRAAPLPAPGALLRMQGGDKSWRCLQGPTLAVYRATVCRVSWCDDSSILLALAAALMSRQISLSGDGHQFNGVMGPWVCW